MDEMEMEQEPLDFEPNLIVFAGEGCKPCKVAEQIYKAQISSGKIKVIDIEKAVEILGFLDCVEAIGYAGVPVLARVENDKVVKCRIGY